jgi:GDP-L-fucose synthase
MASQTFWRRRRVVVAGGRGFLGAPIVRQLAAQGADVTSCSRASGCDLRSLTQALGFFKAHRPEVIFNCAAHQGGIAYQKLRPAEIYYDNLLMGANTMEAARLAGVRLYVNPIAGCAYPGEPRDGILREPEFEAGPMHPTVENYGAAKRAAVTQARWYREQYGFQAISLILVNLYGPGEHFHPDRSHALAALIRKFYEAARNSVPEVVLWGTGRAIREWTYVEDAAEGMIRAAEVYSEAAPLNIATGQGNSISELAEIVREVVGYRGAIVYDSSKPDGALCKVADISKMRDVLHWQPSTSLREGIRKTLEWFIANYVEATREAA